MRKHLLQKRLIGRRAFMLAGMQLGLSGILMSRLFYLQTEKSEDYNMLAEDNRINLQLIIPERGLILDRFSNPIAENKVNYQLFMDRSVLNQREELFTKLKALLEKDYPLEQVFDRQRKRTPHNEKIMLKEHLSWEEVSKIEFNAPDLPGLNVENGTVRYYPLVTYASHLIGYVGTPSPQEAEGNRLLKVPGMKIGKSGLEKKAEEALQGKPGLRHMEVNAFGQYLKEVKRQESVKGDDVRCTISAELQQYASERLGQESGSVVVIDLTNGDVLALCSVPAYDPNRFSKGITHDYWNELMADKMTPLVNKAIGGQYPPGSTFKMLIGLKALEEGQIQEDTRYYCPGHFYLGNHRFNCWKPEGHGHMHYQSAIAQSCDVFFYYVARRLGIEKISTICHEFGLGEHYNLGIIGEKGGLIPTPEWKRATYNQPWQAGDTINTSIGQGYVLTTPLQLAIMAARLATGKKILPRLIIDDTTPFFEEISISKESLALAQAGMIDVTSAPTGTARASQIPVPGFEMAGKTGTAQVRRITVRGQDQSKIPWQFRHHALFVAYAPYQNPRYAASVVIEHGGGGSSAAAPVARDIMLKTQEIMSREGKPS